MSSLPSLEMNKALLETQERNGAFRVHVSGMINEQTPGEKLNPFFQELHRIIQDRGVDQVVLDLKDLAMVNSSGLVCFLGWAKQIQGLQENRYRMKILHDPKIVWQRISLKCMQMMAPQVIEIAETE